MKRFFLSLFDAAHAPLELVGGKGSNLARLAKEGFNVPAGFVVTTQAWHDHTFRFNDLSISEWREAVISTPLSDSFQAGLRRAWEALDTSAVAVRSSATLEDGSERSMAGHFESWLNLSNLADVELAIKRCWASVKADGREHGGAMAVVIQTLITPYASGVLFTRVGNLEADLMGVESVFGLGEALVSGLVSPDRYTLSVSTGDVVRREHSGSPLMLYPTKGSGRLYGDVFEFDGVEHMVLREARFTGVVALQIPEHRVNIGSLSDTAL